LIELPNSGEPQNSLHIKKPQAELRGINPGYAKNAAFFASVKLKTA
jgi:hypothetical protein